MPSIRCLVCWALSGTSSCEWKPPIGRPLCGVWKQTEEGSVSQVCEQQGRFYWVRRSGNPLNGHQRTRSLEIMQDAEGNLYLDDFRESALLLDRDEDRMQIEGYGTFKRQNG